MNRTKNIISLAMVLAMVLSGLTAMLPLAGAEIINVDDDRGIHIGSSTIDNYDPFGDDFWVKPIFPGSQSVIFNIRIDNGGGDAMADDDPITWANLSISTTLRNEAGSSVTSPISNWEVNRVDDMATIWEGNIWTFPNAGIGNSAFQFDVKGNAVPGIYNLTVTLNYKNNIGTADTYVGYILFEIRNRVEVPDIGGLVPGDLNVPVNFPVNFDDNMPGSVVDISISITLPDTGFIWFGVSGSTITKSDDGPFWSWSTWNFQLKLSVSLSKDKGEYTGQYTTTYTISGVEYMETGEITFTVGDLPMLEVSVGTATLAQGTAKVTWSLTFTNTGTVNLLDIKLQLDDDSDAFTFMPADHWEDGGTVTYSWLELGDIAVGASVTQDMDVGIDLYIPEGVHKVMFTFWGMYYDPDTATYQDVIMDWTGGAIGHVPRVNGATFDPDTSTVNGPFIDITVTDTALDISLTSQNPLQADRLVDQNLQLIVRNYGNIDYINVVLKIETNSATSPFLNVVDESALFSEDAMVGGLPSSPFFDPIVTVKVTLKPDVSSGVYSVPVTITGVNADMGELVETTIDARVTITGVGPKLAITAITPGDIKNGADFILTLTITNNGDDSARNVVLTMPSNFFGGSSYDLNGDLASPAANALPMYLADIAPGESLQVEIPMKANKDMSSGHVYVMQFAVDYVDSFGYGPTTAEMNHYVSLKSTGFGGTILGQFYYALIILILVAAIFLIVYMVIYVKKYKKEVPKGNRPTSFEADANTSPQPVAPMADSPSPPPPPQNPPQV